MLICAHTEQICRLVIRPSWYLTSTGISPWRSHISHILASFLSGLPWLIVWRPPRMICYGTGNATLHDDWCPSKSDWKSGRYRLGSCFWYDAYSGVWHDDSVSSIDSFHEKVFVVNVKIATDFLVINRRIADIMLAQPFNCGGHQFIRSGGVDNNPVFFIKSIDFFDYLDFWFGVQALFRSPANCFRQSAVTINADDFIFHRFFHSRQTCRWQC